MWSAGDSRITERSSGVLNAAPPGAPTAAFGTAVSRRLIHLEAARGSSATRRTGCLLLQHLHVLHLLRPTAYDIA